MLSFYKHGFVDRFSAYGNEDNLIDIRISSSFEASFLYVARDRDCHGTVYTCDRWRPL